MRLLLIKQLVGFPAPSGERHKDVSVIGLPDQRLDEIAAAKVELKPLFFFFWNRDSAVPHRDAALQASAQIYI